MVRDPPEGLTKDQTILITKEPQKGTMSGNYQPITCVSATWKLLAGFIAAKVSRHLGQYMTRTQKGIGTSPGSTATISGCHSDSVSEDRWYHGEEG